MMNTVDLLINYDPYCVVDWYSERINVLMVSCRPISHHDESILIYLVPNYTTTTAAAT